MATIIPCNLITAVNGPGLQKVASEFPQLRFALEYKLKEPRTHSFQARAGDTLLMAQEIGLVNVGVCIDVGHSLMASENVAEAAVILQHYGTSYCRPLKKSIKSEPA